MRAIAILGAASGRMMPADGRAAGCSGSQAPNKAKWSRHEDAENHANPGHR